MSFQHPASGKQISFSVAPDFKTEPQLALRRALINLDSTTTCRVIDGHSDGWPGWYVDLFGSYLLSQSAQGITIEQRDRLMQLGRVFSVRGAYHKQLSGTARESDRKQVSPERVFGDPAPDRFNVLENRLQFATSFSEGYSVGLFPDQRDNRRRLLTGYVAAGFPLFESQTPSPEILNGFAYTCAFSVAAACGGARTTSLDLSKKYLDWGKANFSLNRLDPAQHDFIYGDVFDW
jgi:23S rRNA (cytosine1962-C5)-methyltransferase